MSWPAPEQPGCSGPGPRGREHGAAADTARRGGRPAASEGHLQRSGGDVKQTSVADPELMPGSGIIVPGPDPAKNKSRVAGAAHF